VTDQIAPSYSCTGCGARVEYAPGTTVLRCPYCGHEQAVAGDKREVREHPVEELAQLPPRQRTAPTGHAFTCPRCGARTESDALSDACQFCGAPLVADAGQLDRIAPEAVLPFELDRDGARTALRGWVSSRWFAPGRLKKVTEAETLKGTYLPHWTYDARTVTDYQGERGDYYYETESYTETVNGQQVTRTRQVRRTRWRPAAPADAGAN
jgi:DNA-directed RNA polymerase subunit RPC12/RpoP